MTSLVYGKCIGGWYAENYDGSIMFSVDTLKELKEVCKNEGLTLEYREDDV